MYPYAMAMVLVVDDESAIRQAVRAMLERQGYDVAEAGTAEEGIRALRESAFPDVALVDLRLPGKDGMAVLEEARRLGGLTEVVVISGHGTISAAVGAVRSGAFDFLEKPLDRERLLITVRNAARQSAAARRGNTPDPEMIAVSKPMVELLATAARFAPSLAPILITGETGTGKEVLARWIHGKSARRAGPFVALNCAALPEPLAESELFGHVKGAYTGAQTARKGKFQTAERGTLFLDEIGDLSLAIQAKLLRVLEEGFVTPVGSDAAIPVDVRVLAASHHDLNSLVERGGFREDLYFRIAGIKLEVPALRERKEEVAPLAGHFLVEAFARQGWPLVEPAPAFIEALSRHHWPGNVRQLRWAVERAALLSGPLAPGPEHLPEEMASEGGGSDEGSLAGSRKASERRAIVSALERARGNVAQASKALGLGRSRLYEKLQEYGIRPDQYRKSMKGEV